MKITAEDTLYFFRIKFNDIIHLSIKINEVLAMQSWVENDKRYCIEITLTHQVLKYEYDDKDKWIQVISLFEKHKII